MGKSIILADSSCDINIEMEQKLKSIRIINLNVAIDGEGYKDRADLSANEVYAYFDKTGKIPMTSQVTMPEFLEHFERAASEGYTEIIVSCINSEGSNTYSACLQAISLFPDEFPQYKDVIFYPLDARTYSLGHGMPIMQACEMLNSGVEPKEVARVTQEMFDNQITVIGLCSLSYAKKSGRLNAVAAFVGEVLGLKPIMIVNKENKVSEKVRGEHALLASMAKYYKNTAVDIQGDYMIAYGDDIEIGKELEKQLIAVGAKPALGIYPIGTCIACNSGPKMTGMVFQQKKD